MAAERAWNALPASVRTSESYIAFRRQIKMLLFRHLSTMTEHDGASCNCCCDCRHVTLLFVQCPCSIFTVLHICNAVFPILKVSVCQSVTCVNCDKMNESSAEILIPHERKIHVVFRTHRMVGGDAPFYLKFWVELTHPASKTAIFTRYSLVAAQPLEIAKNVPL